jgi:hypothetical protein
MQVIQSRFLAPPARGFWTRFFPFALLAFFIGIYAMGALSVSWEALVTPPAVRTDEEVLRAPARPSADEGYYVQGVDHWERVYFYYTHAPAVCEAGRALNEFQARQCDAFWEALKRALVLAVLPLALLLLVAVWGKGALKGVYQRARGSLSPEKIKGRAVVTSPALAPVDFFSFIYCLKPIQVQLPSGAQTQVYFEAEVPAPLPGQTILLYGPVHELGKPRFYGAVYAPHVAIVSSGS